MRRVVVTGLGIVSSIGNNANEVLASLREAKSGIVAAPEYAERGFRCQVHAAPQIDWESLVDRRAARFLPFHRLYHSVELTMLAFATALVSLVVGAGTADRVLVGALLPLALLALVGHFVAIMASKRVRS